MNYSVNYGTSESSLNTLRKTFFSFTLDPALSREGKRAWETNVKLKYSVSIKILSRTILHIQAASGVEWLNSMLSFLPRHESEGNMKYFVSSTGNRTHNLS